MFAQLFLAAVAVFFFYIGIVEKSIFKIIVGSIAIATSAASFYAAISGSSFPEEFEKWLNKHTKKR